MSSKSRDPELPAKLLAVLPAELSGDPRARRLLARFLGAQGYREVFASDLVAVARGAGEDSWEVRRLAALMLQDQILKIPPSSSGEELRSLLVQLGIATQAGREVRESVLAEGYSTTKLRRFTVELRHRLARAGRVLRPLCGRSTSRRAWRDFLEFSRSDCKLPLARYVFTPEEVVERILSGLRSSHGIEHPFTSGRPFVDWETRAVFARLPPFEAEILERLCERFRILWLAPTTPAELNGLVEAPLATVVAVVKPPGSDLEIELKRAGRPQRRPLGVVFRRNGEDVPPSHRMDAGSMGRSLQWEVIASAVMSSLYRQVHGSEAPIAKIVSLANVSTVPVGAREVSLVDYLTSPAVFGKEFSPMRAALRESVEAFDQEWGSSLEDLTTDLGLTARFLNHVVPAQAVVCGTSSFRLDRLAEYLSRKGPETYFRSGLGREFGRHDARRLADTLLEEALGEYSPPQTEYHSHEGYVGAALALPENRARANRVYLGLMRRLGGFWGVLAGARSHSEGESFVARNVGLKSLWRQGRWEVEIVFMDHDGLRFTGVEGVDFQPQERLYGMRLDEWHLLGGGEEAPGIVGSAGFLERIYAVDDATAKRGRAALRQEAERACRKARGLLADPSMREFMAFGVLAPLRHWDAVVEEFLRHAPGELAESDLRGMALRFLRPRGYRREFIHEAAGALSRYGDFLRRTSFFYG
ncbi:MAG TPA: hypothetical protein VF173_24985 [Thermoanaerobaculia bacterium]|nr:hypothetical protein [Thermoanaerobaculia bacterium]